MKDLNKKVDNLSAHKKDYTTNKKVIMNYICKSEGHTLGELISDKETEYRVCEICNEIVLAKDIRSKDRIEKQKVFVKDNRRFL